MAKFEIKAGTTSKMLNLFIQDNTVTTGAGLTGLTNNSAGLKARYIREGDAASVAIAITSAAIGTYTSGGFIEIEASAMPGVYQIGLPNAVCSANAKSATIMYFGASSMAPNVSELELTVVDNQLASYGLTIAKTTNITGFNDITAAAAATGVWQDATAGDFTVASSIGKNLYINNVAPGAAGGLFIAGANAATTVNFTGNLSGSVGSVTAAVAITSNVKKNQALAGFQFLMTDSTTHTPKTGLTITATRSLDGAAFAACANTAAEISSGWYQINLAATDLNANAVALRFTGTAADDRCIELVTQP